VKTKYKIQIYLLTITGVLNFKAVAVSKLSFLIFADQQIRRFERIKVVRQVTFPKHKNLV